MEDKEYYTHEEMLDVVLGEIGTPERDEYESKMKSFQMGEAMDISAVVYVPGVGRVNL